MEVSLSTTNHTMKTTEALYLDSLSESALNNLQESGYIVRRMGALPGQTNSEYWQLTAAGEQLFHVVDRKPSYMVRLGPAPRDYLTFATYKEAFECSEYYRTEYNKTVCIDEIN